jgi:Erv1 / Alr family
MDGITNSIWGPIYWKMFHYMTLTYPIVPTQNHIEKIKYFFCELVPVILPCHVCRNHYQKNLDLNPLTEETASIKFKLVMWLLNMHNYVNKQLGKDEMSYEESLVSLFIPDNLKEKTQNNTDQQTNQHYQEKNESYNEKSLKNLLSSTVYVPSSNNFIYNIKNVFKQKENELKCREEFKKQQEELHKKIMEQKKNITSEKLKENKKEEEKYKNYIQNMTSKMGLDHYSKKNDDSSFKIEITKQETINMNLVIDKILYYINKCDNDQDKYLIYTGFESICFIFN